MIEEARWAGGILVKAKVNEVWKLISQLTLKEKRDIYKKLKNEMGSEFSAILDRVGERLETIRFLWMQLPKKWSLSGRMNIKRIRTAVGTHKDKWSKLRKLKIFLIYSIVSQKINN